jgi:hypothetical protein
MVLIAEEVAVGIPLHLVDHLCLNFFELLSRRLTVFDITLLGLPTWVSLLPIKSSRLI